MLTPFFPILSCKTKYPQEKLCRIFRRIVQRLIFLWQSCNSASLILHNHAEVAQLVEHSPEKAGVDSSILSLGTIPHFQFCDC